MIIQYLKQLLSSKDCADFARRKWVKINDIESVYAMYLNDKFEIECFKQINTSNYRETNFNAREAIKYAINLNFDHVILFHNHTCGCAEPSEVDKQLTSEALPHYEFFSIHLVDHVILTVNDHFSFADNGLINKYRGKNQFSILLASGIACFSFMESIVELLYA